MDCNYYTSNKSLLDKDDSAIKCDDSQINAYEKFCETSSDDDFVKHKPKSGVFKKFNFWLNRIFASKL